MRNLVVFFLFYGKVGFLRKNLETFKVIVDDYSWKLKIWKDIVEQDMCHSARWYL